LLQRTSPARQFVIQVIQYTHLDKDKPYYSILQNKKEYAYMNQKMLLTL